MAAKFLKFEMELFFLKAAVIYFIFFSLECICCAFFKRDAHATNFWEDDLTYYVPQKQFTYYFSKLWESYNALLHNCWHSILRIIAVDTFDIIAWVSSSLRMY